MNGNENEDAQVTNHIPLLRGALGEIAGSVSELENRIGSIIMEEDESKTEKGAMERNPMVPLAESLAEMYTTACGILLRLDSLKIRIKL